MKMLIILFLGLNAYADLETSDHIPIKMEPATFSNDDYVVDAVKAPAQKDLPLKNNNEKIDVQAMIKAQSELLNSLIGSGDSSATE